MLIGMFDSPFVRSVAIALKHAEIPFEHANWSVGADFDRIREYSPLGRVPTLVIDRSEFLVESQAILDYIDGEVGAARALLPPAGRERRDALQLIALILGAAEKGRDQVYERVFRPAEIRHQPWIDRVNSQMHGALREVERRIAARASEGAGQNAGRTAAAGGWLIGGRFTRADIVVACVFMFLADSVDPALHEGLYPFLLAHSKHCESLPEFEATHVPWFAPQT